MTFLNAALLAGTLAFAMPLIIHLLNRTKFQTVDWGAMHLLDAVLRVNHRRFQLQQWLLLMIRCAIPIILALSLAIPVLTHFQALPKDAPSSVVILIDDSYSMDVAVAAEGDPSTLLQQALQQTEQIMNALPAGSEAQVILAGGRVRTLPDQISTNLRQLITSLQSVTGGAGSCDWQQAFSAAATTVASMHHARRELIVISDFQRHDWRTAAPPLLQELRQRWTTLSTPPVVHLIKLGPRDTSGLRNVAVVGLQPDRPTLGVGQEVRLRVTLKNFSTVPQSGVRVQLKVDEEMVSASTADLGPLASRQLLLTHTFETAGSHVVQAELITEDALPSDNRQFCSLEVLETVEVLLIDGKPSGVPLQAETSFLALALSPFTYGSQPLADLIQTRTIAANQFANSHLGNSRIVIMANVPRLNDNQADALEAFVQAGGALIVFAGDQLATDWYHQRLSKPSRPLLPMRWGPLQGTAWSGDPGDALPDTQTAIAGQFFEHPAMQLFNQTGSGSPADAAIYAWHPLEPSDPPANVIARLDTGQVLMAERPWGDGVVLQVGVAANLRWSNLPLQPVFVPLMQEWIAWMATRGLPPRNIDVGQPAVVHWTGDPGRKWQWLAPDASRSEAVNRPSTENRETFRLAQVRFPGVYTLSGHANDDSPSHVAIHITARADAAESDLDRLDDAEITDIAQLLDGQIFTSADAYLQQENTRRFGREAWRPFLLLLLSLMVAEVVLQQRFAGVRS